MGGGLTKVGEFDININDKLGSGAFGDVYKGTRKSDKEVVAIKKCNFATDQQMEVALTEIKTLGHIPEYEYIVKLYGYHFHNDAAWIAMEYCDQGNLSDMLKSRPMDDKAKVKVMYQIMSGISYMHNLPDPIVHRDLKPQNILFKMVKGEAVAKIADFGLAKVIPDDSLLSSQAGTVLYMAPEVIYGNNYTASVDIFAAGLVFLVVITYDGNHELEPYSVGQLKKPSIKRKPVGIELLNAALDKRPAPVIVEHHAKDSHIVKEVKDLIKAMTKLEDRKRISPKAAKGYLKALLKTDGKRRKSESDSGACLDKEEGATGIPEFGRKKKGTASDYKRAERSMAELMSVLGHSECGTLQKSKFKRGQRVRVDSRRDYVIQMQQDHGGWNDGMAQYLGKMGWVEKVKGISTIVVKLSTGDRVTYNADCLHEVPDDEPDDKEGRFKFYDIVQVISDPERLKKKQKALGEWNTDVVMNAGKRGLVNKIRSSGAVSVEMITGDKLQMNPDSLEKVDISKERFQKGDIVLVPLDRRIVQASQGKDPGWNDDMEECLGDFGVILDMKSPTIAKVKIKGTALKWHVRSLKLIGSQDEILEARRSKKSTSDAMVMLAHLLL